MQKKILGLVLVAFAFVVGYGCPPPKPAPPPTREASAGSTITLKNTTGKATKVYAAFGADSVVLPPAWSFCAPSSTLTCTFAIDAGKTQDLPTGGAYLNVTISFGQPVGCGATKVELNVNNPKWYDVVDLSLVDGFSVPVSMVVDGTTLGPVLGPSNNQGLYGVFPLGCDICVARSSQTPCGQTPGTSGCKAGTQYDPKPPCQHQGKVMGGGSVIEVSLLP